MPNKGAKVISFTQVTKFSSGFSAQIKVFTFYFTFSLFPLTLNPQKDVMAWLKATRHGSLPQLSKIRRGVELWQSFAKYVKFVLVKSSKHRQNKKIHKQAELTLE